jgi:hypothetical protein
VTSDNSSQVGSTAPIVFYATQEWQGSRHFYEFFSEVLNRSSARKGKK